MKTPCRRMLGWSVLLSGGWLVGLLPGISSCLLFAENEAPFDWRQVATDGLQICAVRSTQTWSCFTRGLTPPPGDFTDVQGGNDQFCGLDVDGQITCIFSLPVLDVPNPEGSFTQFDISEGYSGAHGCGVLEDSTVRCWGNNADGVSEPPEGPFLQVAVNQDASCGIREDASLECWGNSAGWPYAPPSGAFSAIDLGRDFACGIRLDGELDCWGSPSVVASLEIPSGPFSQLSVGFSHACGLTTAGEVRCFGDNTFYQADPPAGTFRQIATGGDTSCLVTQGYGLRCWGRVNLEKEPVP